MTRDELKKAVPSVPAEACDVCGKEMAWVYNVESRNTGPIDHRCPVYVVRTVCDGKGRPLAMTAKDFMDILVEAKVRVGGEEVVWKREDFLGFFVSHFSTCPGASRIHEQKKRGRR